MNSPVTAPKLTAPVDTKQVPLEVSEPLVMFGAAHTSPPALRHTAPPHRATLPPVMVYVEVLAAAASSCHQADMRIWPVPTPSLPVPTTTDPSDVQVPEMVGVTPLSLFAIQTTSRSPAAVEAGGFELMEVVPACST